MKQWTVDQCTDRFVRLCAQAFVAKPVNKFVPDKLAVFKFKWNRYKTKPLYEVLRQEFGDDALYGKVPDDAVVRDTKVCITTTPVSAEYAMAIGNYARQSEEDTWYKYERGDFLRVWQAAAVTSAAPGYFKKFTLTHNDRIHTQFRIQNQFLDGALFFNNPVRLAFNERRFLWPDVADTPPDIVLSLGTGQNAQAITSAIGDEPMSRMPKSRTLCLPESKFVRLKKAFRDSSDRQPGFIKNMAVALVSPAHLLDRCFTF